MSDEFCPQLPKGGIDWPIVDGGARRKSIGVASQCRAIGGCEKPKREDENRRTPHEITRQPSAYV
jgi:hypothetical protein